MVIAELRPKDADGYAYAKKVKDQIKQLLDTGVPANHITVVGASKGSVIAAVVSYLLDNEQINYMLLGSCYTEMIPEWKQSHMYLHGNILSIYDSVDNMAGSCRELFSISAGKGIARHDEIVLHAGTGHGILYKPLDEWMLPTIEWAK